MIEIIKSASSEISIDPKEVAVYLGYYSANGIDPKIIDECIAEITDCASYKACFAKVPVTDGGIDFGCLKACGKSLQKNLEGCDFAYVLAATTGFEVQRLIERNSVISPLKGLVTDCAGSAAIEAFCDKINSALDGSELLRPRFSPGYGDLPLECQKGITEFLGTSKNIGLSLTESMMMTPVKSVTAIIGIGKEKNKCTGPGCMICRKTDCPYR